MGKAEIAALTVVEPSAEALRLAYRVAVRSRATEEHIVRLASRGEVKFAIWGPGEEVHGTATALALHQVVDVRKTGMVLHYRSGSLASMWCELHGREGFTRDVLRQQFSKETDFQTRGRQMVYHLHMPEVGLLPVQSPVGMQLGKAAGYALGFKARGLHDGFAMAVIGDGTTAEGDLHDAMNAASVWQLPLLILVTDNGVAISTRAADGRGIKDFSAYAQAFGLLHASADGRDFFDVYRTTAELAGRVRGEQRPALLHVHDLPRFNGHSSAADMSFDLSQDDPLIAFGEELVRRGLLAEGDILRRKPGQGRDFFAHHDLGAIMAAEDAAVQKLFAEVRAEPDPPPASIFDGIYAPFPAVEERPTQGSTNITYAGAIRAALAHILGSGRGLLWGEDVARLGGVMQATAGLQARFPGRIFDSPLNEPLIVGTAMGLGLHEDLVALPEIQFGDYALNAFHWLVHLGNLHWCTNGHATSAVILRMPVDPFGGGSVYHSMSVDGYFTPIPGLVVVMPSTSWDAYGLLLTAADYRGPVVCLEPKWMYRQALGPAFPGEPTDPEAIAAMKKALMRGEIPDLDPSLRVPFGRAALRRHGTDLTMVAWGRAVWTCLRAAEALAKEGIEAEVLDLRTLVPPDFEAVYQSVGRTGRLIVAAEDRAFAGFVRSIQGAAVERFPGLPSRALGQKNVPGIAQSLVLEEATVLTQEDVVHAARDLLDVRVGGTAGWSWVPPRYFLG